MPFYAAAAAFDSAEEKTVFTQYIQNLKTAAPVYIPLQLVTFFLPLSLQLPWLILGGSFAMKHLDGSEGVLPSLKSAVSFPFLPSFLSRPASREASEENAVNEAKDAER